MHTFRNIRGDLRDPPRICPRTPRGPPPGPGTPPGPRKSRIFPEIPGFRAPGGPPPGGPKTRILAPRRQIWAPGPALHWGRAGRMSRDPGFPGSGVCSPCRDFGGFRGAAALLINVFFGQVLVCFFCAGRCGAGTPPGGVRGFPGSGPGILRIPDSAKNLGVIY